MHKIQRLNDCSKGLFLAIPVPLVYFGPVELQPPGELSDLFSFPDRVLEVLALQDVDLLLRESAAAVSERLLSGCFRAIKLIRQIRAPVLCAFFRE